jgi:hypothetical protein
MPYLAYTGRDAEARVMFEDHRAELARPGEPNMWGAWQWAFGAVEGLVVLGERDEAATLYPAVKGALEDGAVLGGYHDGRLVERVAAMAAAAGRDWDRAEAHFRIALHLASVLPHPLEQAETRRWYGRMLVDRNASGDENEAARLSGEAAEIYRRLGMPRHSQLAANPRGSW